MRGKGTRDQRRKERERKGWRRKRKKKDFRRQQLRIQLQGGDVHVGKALDTLCPFFDFVLDDQPVHLRRFDRFFWHCFIRPFSTGDQKSNIGWMRTGRGVRLNAWRTSWPWYFQLPICVTSEKFCLQGEWWSWRTGHSIEMMNQYYPIASFDAVCHWPLSNHHCLISPEGALKTEDGQMYMFHVKML